MITNHEIHCVYDEVISVGGNTCWLIVPSILVLKRVICYSNIYIYYSNFFFCSLAEVLQEPVGKNLQFAYHDTSSRLDGDNVGSFSFNTFNKELDYSDGFCGTRRDIQVPGVQRPWTLDGSSASSVDGEYYCQISSSPQRLFKHGPVMRDYHDPRRYSGQFREGIDPRYIQSDYGGLAAAEGHTLTGTMS